MSRARLIVELIILAGLCISGLVGDGGSKSSNCNFVPSDSQRVSTALAFGCANIVAGEPATGASGTTDLDIRGEKSSADGESATFAVIDALPQRAGTPMHRIAKMELRLVQRIESFSKDGKLQFYVAIDADSDITAVQPLAIPELPTDVAKDGGPGKQLNGWQPLGSGTFRPVITGHVDHFPLACDRAVETYLRDRVRNGAGIRLIIVPDSDEAAATYYGVNDRGVTVNRPVLTIELEL